jgi:hypothetical protein
MHSRLLVKRPAAQKRPTRKFESRYFFKVQQPKKFVKYYFLGGSRLGLFRVDYQGLQPVWVVTRNFNRFKEEMGYNPKGYNPIFSTRLNFSLQMIYTFEFLVFKIQPISNPRVATQIIQPG